MSTRSCSGDATDGANGEESREAEDAAAPATEATEATEATANGTENGTAENGDHHVNGNDKADENGEADCKIKHFQF